MRLQKNILPYCGKAIIEMKLVLLITGANGFVGHVLCEEAVSRGFRVKGTTRTACHLPSGVENVVIGTIDGRTNWTAALEGVDVVIHLAARVHVMKDISSDPLAEFLKVNMQGTANLACQAATSGVKRLVYVSSIKVNGEETFGEQSYSEQDFPAPQDPYGTSKWEAEQALWRVAQETGIEIVVVRPPLVYGAGVKGNFAKMMQAVARGIPLPFASVINRRDLIYIGNLVDALIACATHPAAAGQTYMVSDGENISTPELLRRLGSAMGHPARLFPLPPGLLKWGGMLSGRAGQLGRLLGSLQVDGGKIRHELGWQPPYTLERGLYVTAVAFDRSQIKV